MPRMRLVGVLVLVFSAGLALGVRLGRMDGSDLRSTFGSYVSAWGSPVTPLELGATAPDFDLLGVDDRRYGLASFAEAEVLAIVFTCNHCPTAQAYEDRLAQIARDYEPRGVQLVAITTNDPKAVRLDELGYTDLGDSLEDTRQRAADRAFPFPYLYDGDDQSAGRAYGPLATPHVFVFDRERRLRFRGRVDDNENPRRTRRHDLRLAIESLLRDAPVEEPDTRPFGCSIKWSDKRPSVAEADERWAERSVQISDITPADVAALAANTTERWRLVNVWATWCAPCVAELPALVEIHRMYQGRGLDTSTISLDTAERNGDALAMLREHRVALENHRFAGDGVDALADALDPAFPGPVPYTVLIAPGGRVAFRQIGAFDPLVLKRAIVQQLGRTYF